MIRILLIGLGLGAVGGAAGTVVLSDKTKNAALAAGAVGAAFWLYKNRK